MARLESEIKLGYYKTPVTVVEKIKNNLKINNNANTVRFLDPCCGEGEALSILTDGIKDVESYGIELEKNRFEKAAQVLTKTMWADSLEEAQVGYSSFDLLWLNPPYDFSGDEAVNGQNKRFEYLFLTKYSPTLVKNGILVYIIPERILLHDRLVADYICSKFEDIEIYRFPSEEYEAFKQIVLIAKKSNNHLKQFGKNREVISDFFANHNKLDLTSLKEIMLEGTKKSRIFFQATHIEADEILSLPATKTAKNLFFKTVSPPKLVDMHPLTNLRQGHLGMLLAAGYVNGEIKTDTDHLIIKGTVSQEKQTTQEIEGDSTITRTIQKAKISVRVLDMLTGKIEMIA
ncbi:MAG: class I SAM-dependent methyltransferase [Desulfobacterales bacterium]|nr:class I SAM-dependent methyltransferase [Desulfobacterales bacterium]